MHTASVKQLIANLLPEDIIEFEERSAIMEYMGGLSREDAESAALSEVMAKRIRGEK